MTTVTSPAAATAGREQPSTPARPAGSHLLAGLARRPLALVSAGYLLALVIMSAGASWLAPAGPQTEDLAHVRAGPSAAHWLGTDLLGRDILSRLMYGGQVTLLGVAEALVVFAGLGITLGLLAGYLGGTADRVISRFADLVLALPGIIVLLMVLAVFPGSNLAAMIALGLIGCPTMLRVVRGSTLAIRGELYISAARLSGLTNPRIMRRHVLPRLAGPIIVQLTLFAASAVLVQSALAFLGLSTPDAQAPTWGNMVAGASGRVSEDPWLLIPTGGVLILTVMALGLLGDAVRDVTTGRHLALAPPRPRRRAARAPSAAPTAGAAPTVGAQPTASGQPPTGGQHPAGAQRAAGTEPVQETGRGTTGPAGRPAPLLSVRGLSIAFAADGQDITAVRDVSFDLAPGEALGIVGESGCGKTVTTRALLGLLPHGGRVTAGAILLNGRDIATLPEREYGRIRGSTIGLISQEPMSGLDPSFRVGSQLTEVIRRHNGLSRRQAKTRALELLDMVNLPDPAGTASRYPHELSGGMAQRVSIALALAPQPRLLIADEPTTALDVTVQAEILALLRDLSGRLGMAVICVTHDWGVLADLCDRALVMYAGEVVEQASVEDLYRSPRHPYTEGLLKANPHLAPLGQALPAIPGTVPPPSSWPAGCHFKPRCRYATSQCAAGPIPMVSPGPARLSRCVHSGELEGVR